MKNRSIFLIIAIIYFVMGCAFLVNKQYLSGATEVLAAIFFLLGALKKWK